MHTLFSSLVQSLLPKDTPLRTYLHFRENGLIFWGIWGEAELILRIWGAKEKYFQGAEVLSFRDLGEI